MRLFLLQNSSKPPRTSSNRFSNAMIPKPVESYIKKHYAPSEIVESYIKKQYAPSELVESSLGAH